MSFFVGVGTTSHIAKAEVTEMARGCIVLTQGGAVNHMPGWLWRRACFYFLLKVQERCTIGS